ncbi:peptidase S41 [Erythrobacter sp. 3-20A1M]|uniref:S41 family peptidase n=1 Tax=Erythrobacter sp. 3-20A1M TaxID=2653850 RepID=UPI001BFC6435|nr:S41 family peptidase [Erythrobacter sp. 3-20A1M]QWC57349.1 peptidase S41 [Erythrobacter sp. 3-20A1M]
MGMGRTSLLVALAGALAACGGGGSGGSGSGPTSGGNTGGGSSGGGTSGGGSASGTCSLTARQNWVFEQLDQYYLFPDKLARNLNPGAYATVQDYIDALVAPSVFPTGGPLQRAGLTYITSIQEEEELINSGASAGFGVRFALSSSNRLYVLEAFENGPAYPQGLDRGTEIISINGKSVAQLLSNGTINEELGPSTPGLTVQFRIRQPDGMTRDVSVTKTVFSLDPISDRYGVKILDNGGTKVGYINLRTFIVADAAPQLRAAFGQLKAQGITQVIVDLRYNGGGLTSVAEVFGSLLGADQVGKVFSHTVFRNSLAQYNETVNFSAEPNAIPAMKIAFIGTGSTASASELVANAFIPYLGNNTALIGSNTYGKPVGQIALDREACDDRLRAIAFRTTNANDQGDYYGGLASVFPVTCRATDDYLKPLGDPTEASVATALDFLAGRSCTPITGSSTARTTAGTKATMRVLQPAQPGTLERDVPGAY